MQLIRRGGMAHNLQFCESLCRSLRASPNKTRSKKGSCSTFAMVGFADVFRLMTLHLRHHSIIIRLRSRGAKQPHTQRQLVASPSHPVTHKELGWCPINWLRVQISFFSVSSPTHGKAQVAQILNVLSFHS